MEKTPQINGPAVFSDKPPNLLSMDDAMSIHINTVLKHTNGKISGPGGAAEILGLPYSTLRHRMHKLGIHSGKRKGSSFQKIN
ncbi:MAG: hypothetical protein R2874_07905 [Desulfobacterales bacterium]